MDLDLKYIFVILQNSVVQFLVFHWIATLFSCKQKKIRAEIYVCNKVMPEVTIFGRHMKE